MKESIPLLVFWLWRFIKLQFPYHLGDVIKFFKVKHYTAISVNNTSRILREIGPHEMPQNCHFWLRLWLGTFRKHVTTWVNVDQDLWRYKASLESNGSMQINQIIIEKNFKLLTNENSFVGWETHLHNLIGMLMEYIIEIEFKDWFVQFWKIAVFWWQRHVDSTSFTGK